MFDKIISLIRISSSLDCIKLTTCCTDNVPVSSARMAFTCSFCKFRTFEEKDIEAHLESAVHQETLEHIRKQTKFDKVVMEFLHVSNF